MIPPANKPLYRVRRSGIHGRGVFAAAPIAKGALIAEYRGQRTTWDEVNRRPDSDPANPHHTFIFEISDGSVIDGGRRGNAARWINHSCAPNCRTFEDDDGRVFVEARRAIAAGEELTYDYRLALDGRVSAKTRAAYACRCGAQRCRGSLLLEG
jgi:SET domain-containing protein